MTIQTFLRKTDLPKVQIAKFCGVDVSQVYRWENDGAIPEGGPLLRLVELSKGEIKAKDLPGPRKGEHFRSNGTGGRRSSR